MKGGTSTVAWLKKGATCENKITPDLSSSVIEINGYKFIKNQLKYK